MTNPAETPRPVVESVEPQTQSVDGAHAFSRRNFLKGVGLGAVGAGALYVAKTLEPFVEIAEAASKKEIVRLTPSEAARRYGLDSHGKIIDRYVYNHNHWIIRPDGSAFLKPDPRGKTHRVAVGGAVWDGSIKVNGDGFDHIRVVVDPVTKKGALVDISSGTATLYKALSTQNFYDKLNAARNAEKYTDVPVEPLCTPQLVDHRGVKTSQLAPMTRAWAAANLGISPYTQDPNSWEENEFGGVWLKPQLDPTQPDYDKTFKIKIFDSEFVVDGWIKTDMDESLTAFDAIPTVSMSKGPKEMRVVALNGGTIWRTQDQSLENRLFWQVLDQVQTKERKPAAQGGQPGTYVATFSN